LDIGVLGYIGIVWPKEHSPEVVTLTRGTPCIIVSSQLFFVKLLLSNILHDSASFQLLTAILNKTRIWMICQRAVH